jgi:hypothetical protein
VPELRVAVTMFQSARVEHEPLTGRARDDERDDHAVLLPKGYLAVLQLVGALLVTSVIIVKLLAVWQLDALLGFGEPRP